MSEVEADVKVAADMTTRTTYRLAATNCSPIAPAFHRVCVPSPLSGAFKVTMASSEAISAALIAVADLSVHVEFDGLVVNM